MKRAAWVVLVPLVLAHPLWAQEGEQEEPKPEEETLIGDGIDSGGFGALVFKFSGVADQFAVFAGARGGWIINHRFVVGGGGYGLASEICLDEDEPCFLRQIEFGYGGFEFEYIGLWDRVAHYSLQLLIGGGGVSLLGFEADPVFVAEPAARLELNVTKWFRLNLGGGYRFVSGVDVARLDNSDLSAFTGVLEFKFGNF